MSDKQYLKGTTSILVLKTISKNDCYGYEIIKQISRESQQMFDLKQGTLYPILHNLEKKNLIESYWQETDQSRKRKYYKITSVGSKFLVEKQKEWQGFKNMVDQLLVASSASLKSG